MSRDRNPIRDQLTIYAPAVLMVLAASLLAFQFIKPAPPRHVVMATGAPEGAYHQFAERYAAVLAREGITLELRPTAGSVENLALLRAGEVSLALVQGGVDDGKTAPGLYSLGSVYYEPLWLFYRKELVVRRIGDLAGRRVAVGPDGSGTRALADLLMRENDLGDTATPISRGGQGAVDDLVAGRVDAAFFVMSAQSELIRELLENPDVVLADFDRAAAYAQRFRFLNQLELPEGVYDLAGNVPNRKVRLLAPAANLVSHPDLHPAVIDLMLQAASEVHSQGGFFEERDEFPSARLLSFPLSKEAERYYKHGPPLLQRFLPFWAASLVDRLKVMLLPLLVLLFPLIKVMPPIYTWRMRARVYRWYEELENAERRLAEGEGDAAALRKELDRIESEVRQVKVPLSFTDQLYHLRAHIELVRRAAPGSPGPKR